MRILIVEDEGIVRQFLVDLLTEMGHEVQAACDGREGVEKALALDLDVVLSDINMPLMDGLELLHEIRSTRASLPVILLTGRDDVKPAIKAVKEGAYDYMQKPVDMDDLDNCLKRLERELELRRRAEEERQRAIYAARLAAVGRLAAGVAHEINNPTTYIRGNTQIMKALCQQLRESLEAEAGPAQRENIGTLCGQFPELLDGIERGTERIRRITYGLTRFSDSQKFEPQAEGSVNACLEDALLLLGEPKDGPAIEMSLKPDLPLIKISRQALTQAFLCVLVNAFQEVAGAGKRMRVATSSRPDGGVLVVVEDSGSGIPAELRERVFEPFFTTKEVNEGAGLGLSVAYGIIQSDHGGTIAIDDSPLGGARISMALPANAGSGGTPPQP